MAKCRRRPAPRPPHRGRWNARPRRPLGIVQPSANRCPSIRWGAWIRLHSHLIVVLVLIRDVLAMEPRTFLTHQRHIILIGAEGFRRIGALGGGAGLGARPPRQSG